MLNPSKILEEDKMAIEQITPQTKQNGDPGTRNAAPPEECICITIIANTPGQVISEFHRQNLCEKGYSISSRILPHSFARVNDNGRTDKIFEGEKLYAGTFMRNSCMS